MAANKLLKVVLSVVVLAVIGIFMLIFSSSKDTNDSVEQSSPQSLQVFDLTLEEQRKLGNLVGDSYEDTLRTLVTLQRNLNDELKQIRSENEKIIAENERLRASIHADGFNTPLVDDTPPSAIAHLEMRQKQFEELWDKKLENFEAQLNESFNYILTELSNQQKAGIDTIPIHKGDDLSSTKPVNGGDELIWILPNGQVIDANSTDNQGDQLGSQSPFDLIEDTTAIGKSVRRVKNERGEVRVYEEEEVNQNDEISVTPYYTIARNATLVGSRSMTALIGRVPINGTLSDPFPFKAVIGRENLIANGIELPDVQGAIISGSSSGDWTLSCVTGRVTSITFVFNDGRIVSLPREGDERGIGYISTEEGVPCIVGERKSNALEYLSSAFGLGALAGLGEGLSDAQVEKQGGANLLQGANIAEISKVTGDLSKFVLGRAISNGTKEISQWFAQRYGQTFDAIYVSPNQPLAINITSELRIDYDDNARKVNYFNEPSSHELD